MKYCSCACIGGQIEICLVHDVWYTLLGDVHVLRSVYYSSESGKRQTFKSIVQFLSDLSHAQRLLMSQVCTVVSLVLLMPATNAISGLAHFVG